MAFYTFLPKILNMSLTASVAIVFVLLLRLLLKKAPKVISYALWAVVLIRLLCPVSIESGLSLFGLFDTPTVDMTEHSSAVEYIPSNIVHTEFPENRGNSFVFSPASNSYGDPIISPKIAPYIC